MLKFHTFINEVIVNFTDNGFYPGVPGIDMNQFQYSQFERKNVIFLWVLNPSFYVKFSDFRIIICLAYSNLEFFKIE